MGIWFRVIRSPLVVSNLWTPDLKLDTVCFSFEGVDG